MNGVTIILSVHRRDHLSYFRLAIESILTQTIRNVHIYVGVDGPVDKDLQEYLEALESQTQVDVIWFQENRGLACVLNDLLDICLKEGCEFIARMDADDISLPDRFEKQINYLEHHRDIDVVGGAITEIDEKGNSRDKIIIYPNTPEGCRAFFARRNPHAHPAVMFRRRFFEKAGCKYRPEYRQNQDTMLWYDGMVKGTQHANIPDVVLKFRVTDAMFKKRRNGWSFAKKQFLDRLKINRGLGYGIGADVFGFAMFCMLLSPVWIKKVAYRLFR